MQASAVDRVNSPTFQKLRHSIDEQKCKRESLQSTATLLTQEGSFDKEDLTVVNKLLLEVVKEEERLREVLAYRQKIWDEQLRSVQETMHTRNAILERITVNSDTFEHFPQLANLFAKKQVKLANEVQTLTKKLESDWQ
jgi:hypothetical protein